MDKARRTWLYTIGDYRKGWATRYLREAKAELRAAKKTPYMASSFIVEALRKAQASIYYSLGDPSFIVPIVHETIHSGQDVKEPILNFLVEIERTLQQLANCPTSDDVQILAQVSDIIDFASEIGELLGGEVTV